jgi:hypothetical protein
MFANFYHGILDIAKLNRAMICLISKVPTVITEFRPIWLLNCSYKIILKVLAKRLQVVLTDIIGESQSVFLKN